jgi:hypothetical protein
VQCATACSYLTDQQVAAQERPHVKVAAKMQELSSITRQMKEMLDFEPRSQGLRIQLCPPSLAVEVPDA